MALKNRIAPQAYTRDTLVKAIEWLSGQPPAVRERVNSADLIVSHYLQARRQNGTALAVEAAPSPSQDLFHADLKSLAEDIKQFEDAPAAPPPPAPSRAPSHVKPVLEDQLETIVSQHRQDSLFRQQGLLQQERPEPPAVRQTEVTVKGLSWTVDARSLAVARELQEALNLSNEAEALRMLVSLGAERVRALIP